MCENGWYVKGYYVGQEMRSFKSKNGQGYEDVYNVMIVVGANAYRIKVEEEVAVEFESLAVGSLVLVRCRPYVGTTGKMGITEGELVEAE